MFFFFASHQYSRQDKYYLFGQFFGIDLTFICVWTPGQNACLSCQVKDSHGDEEGALAWLA